MRVAKYKLWLKIASLTHNVAYFRYEDILITDGQVLYEKMKDYGIAVNDKYTPEHGKCGAFCLEKWL